MSPRKRLHRIETSLPPLEAALLWLNEMLELGQERYSHEMLADLGNPRAVLAHMIGKAVRENLGDPPLNRERLEQAVRQAQKQGDMLMVLVLTLHDHIRPKLIVARTELLEERFARILSQTSLLGLRPKSWDLFERS